MTAEAVLLNSRGVALAADSALTTGWQTDGRVTSARVYNSARKIFPLGDGMPRAVMFWGDASFRGVPWSALCAEFAASSACRRAPGVTDCASAFADFVRRRTPKPGRGDEEREFEAALLGLYQSVIDLFISGLDDKPKDRDPVLARAIESHIAELDVAGAPMYEDLKAIGKNASFRRITDWCIKKRFAELKPSNQIRYALRLLAAHQLHLTEKTGSGMVVAGYGRRGLLPGYALIGKEPFRGVLRAEESFQVTPKSTGIARLLARYDMANTFITGVNEGLMRHVDRTMEKVARQGLGLDCEAPLSRKDGARVDKIMSEARGEIEAFVMERHQGPFQDGLTGLPLEELASCAEMLVGLNAYQSRVFDDQPCVGGPIDVAVISRDRGFEWVRCKDAAKVVTAPPIKYYRPRRST